MELYINTIKNSGTDIEIMLSDGNTTVASIITEAQRQQAEKLVPEIEKILRDNNVALDSLKCIRVEDAGGTFTALRIGIVTANTLGFALGIPVVGAKEAVDKHIDSRYKFSVVKPRYDSEPNITKKKSKF